MEERTMICPICASALTLEQQQCPSCKNDLTAYLTLAYQPDVLFNDAISRMKREDYDDACDLLCRASALRPDDVQIKQLWMRACYGAGNLKKAVSLMLDLLEAAPSETLSAQYEQLMREYEHSVASPETLVRELLLQQSDRMEALIGRMEQLSAPTAQTKSPSEGGNHEPL
jgi:hypothetical protein